MMPGRQACEQTGTGRCTAGSRGVAVSKQGTILRQCIQIRGDDGGITHAVQGVTSMLVRYYQDDVWLLLGHKGMRKTACSCAQYDCGRENSVHNGLVKSFYGIKIIK
ncbi:hypothetical protein BACPLE_03688 [Phocaeicola plebeius DSM 17135]|uniref:Uncharacterized protein n=1 Tax=Phocaeicola plebeius (strain DSM 17135 / JCM 12973 / CCUG 54634 / M2) TaxID=484018 RepID=B5D3T4_PHOPM|nr:hypothetical protein BACPLE_03688 [Phocaeicola plebeius DSM 17135]